MDDMQGLIEVLLDRSASISERDDAAMDLGDYDQALDTLIHVAQDGDESEVVLGACGTSIAEIWKRLGAADDQVLGTLAPAAQAEVRASFA